MLQQLLQEQTLNEGKLGRQKLDAQIKTIIKSCNGVLDDSEVIRSTSKYWVIFKSKAGARKIEKLLEEQIDQNKYNFYEVLIMYNVKTKSGNITETGSFRINEDGVTAEEYFDEI